MKFYLKKTQDFGCPIILRVTSTFSRRLQAAKFNIYWVVQEISWTLIAVLQIFFVVLICPTYLEVSTILPLKRQPRPSFCLSQKPVKKQESLRTRVSTGIVWNMRGRRETRNEFLVSIKMTTIPFIARSYYFLPVQKLTYWIDFVYAYCGFWVDCGNSQVVYDNRLLESLFNTPAELWICNRATVKSHNSSSECDTFCQRPTWQATKRYTVP